MLADWSFGQVMWAMFVFFAWVLFFWMLFSVFGDLFRRHDIGGWGKAGWTIFVIVLPFLGILVYFIAEGRGMGERSTKQVQEMQARQAQYASAAVSDSAEQIAKAKQLLDSGAITQAEFDTLKAKALGA
jgi:hypothetical protein